MSNIQHSELPIQETMSLRDIAASVINRPPPQGEVWPPEKAKVDEELKKRITEQCELLTKWTARTRAQVHFHGLDVFEEARKAAEQEDSPILMVGNHPWGVGDGILAYYLMNLLDPNGKVFAEDVVALMPPLAAHSIPVDSKGKMYASYARETVNFKKGKISLGVFPGGFSEARGEETENPRNGDDIRWQPGLFTLAFERAARGENVNILTSCFYSNNLSEKLLSVSKPPFGIKPRAYVAAMLFLLGFVGVSRHVQFAPLITAEVMRTFKNAEDLTEYVKWTTLQQKPREAYGSKKEYNEKQKFYAKKIAAIPRLTETPAPTLG